MTTDPFKVTCDECAVTFKWFSGGMEFKVEMPPQQARRLGQELIDRAQDCEDAQEHEMEQMR